jgi:hypothetical protein
MRSSIVGCCFEQKSCASGAPNLSFPFAVKLKLSVREHSHPQHFFSESFLPRLRGCAPAPLAAHMAHEYRPRSGSAFP